MKYDKNILYLDIETAPAQNLVDQDGSDICHLWSEKMEKLQNADEKMKDLSMEEQIQQGGLYAEFGRIVCISFGSFYEDKTTGEDKFCVTSAYGTDEKSLLEKFANMLEAKKLIYTKLCGHNAKEFDIPYIIRRMLIHKIALPPVLRLQDKKPWEMPIIDTMELWKCGSYRYAAQLKLLCAVFGIKTPKDDIDGSEVAGVFYKEKDYKRISVYCEKDVVATMQVHLNICGMNSINEDTQIVHVPTEPFLLV